MMEVALNISKIDPITNEQRARRINFPFNLVSGLSEFTQTLTNKLHVTKATNKIVR